MTRGHRPQNPAEALASACGATSRRFAALGLLAALASCRARAGERDPQLDEAFEAGRAARAQAPRTPAARPPESTRAPRALRASVAPAARAYAKVRFAWIHEQPSHGAATLGYLTLGESVALRREPAAGGTGHGCTSWLPIEPEGWLCAGRDVSTDAAHPVVRFLSDHRADLASPWPFHYARSRGAPRYPFVPGEQDQVAREGRGFLATLARARALEPDARARETPAFAGVDLGLSGLLPPSLLPPGTVLTQGMEDIPPGSTLAWVRRFDANGRSFLMTWDHAVVPVDRVELFDESGDPAGAGFAGVSLEGDSPLPLAFARAAAVPFYRCDASGCAPTGEHLAPRSAVALAKGPAAPPRDRPRLVHTRDGRALPASELIVVDPLGVPPKALSNASQGSQGSHGARGRRTWLEVSTVGGWLVAFEGARPVFATLVSAGRGDRLPSGEMNGFSSTPSGTYPIGNKLRTATMQSPERPGRTVAEVMYTQVFHGAFALHGAYWHADWGERKSAGCVNVSPKDARWLFEWTEPPVPADWHARTTRRGEPTTWIVIHP